MKLLVIILSLILSFESAYTADSLVSVEALPFYNKSGSEQNIKVAFRFMIKDGWHIYWRNPGDAGLPTKIELLNPGDIQVNNVNWPIPQIFTTDDITNFGYAKEVTLFAELKSNKQIVLPLEIKFTVSWLVCKEICLPGKDTLTVVISENTESGSNINYLNEFFTYQARIPDYNHSLKTELETFNGHVVFKIYAVEEAYTGDVTFLSYQSGYLSNGKKQEIDYEDGALIIKVWEDDFVIEMPEIIEGIVISTKNWKNYKKAIYIKNSLKMEEK